MRARILAQYFQARFERFWHIEYLEMLVEDLRFNSQTAAWIAHAGLREEMQKAGALWGSLRRGMVYGEIP